jgi:uncharacterized protein YjbJ (UPF0337 family)
MQIELTVLARIYEELRGKNLFLPSAWQLRKEIRFCKPGRQINMQRGMSVLEFKANWNIAKGKLKQRFARLTDDELQFAEGKEDELVGRIQKRTSRAHKMAVENSVND